MRIRMTKEVLVTISGLQFSPETESESVELITSGSYYKKNGKHYIIYDEVMEGFEGSTKNIIKLTEDSLDVTKKGVTNVHMVFEENKKNLTCYSTPYGNLMIGIEGGPVSIQETDDRIEVRANYSLDINYEHVANCEIRMHIQSKDAQQFSLTEM